MNRELFVKYKSLVYDFRSFNEKLLDRIDYLEESHKSDVKEYNRLVRRLTNRLSELQEDNSKLKAILTNRNTYEGLLK